MTNRHGGGNDYAMEIASHISWWEGAAGALLGAMVASAIPIYVSWRARRIERRGELAAMQDEMQQAKDVMGKLLAMKAPQATSLRVPRVMLERGYPKIIGEGLLTPMETSALVEYVTQVEALNRALDQAGQAAAANNYVGVHYQIGLGMTSAKIILENMRPDMGDQSICFVVEKAILRLREERSVWGILQREVCSVDQKEFSARMLEETFRFAHLALANAVLINGAAATAVAAFLAHRSGPVPAAMHCAILWFALGAGFGGLASMFAYFGQRLDWAHSAGRDRFKWLIGPMVTLAVAAGVGAYVMFFVGCYAAASGF